MSKSYINLSYDESPRIEWIFKIYSKKVYDIGLELSESRDLENKHRNIGKEMLDRNGFKSSLLLWKKMMIYYKF